MAPVRIMPYLPSSPCADHGVRLAARVAEAPATSMRLPRPGFILRSRLQPAADEAEFLRLAAIAIGGSGHFVDIGIAFLVHRAQQSAECLEDRLEVALELELGVGAVDH